MPCGGTDDFEVIVVGAGAAGLGAAMRLAAAKVSFTVLEARGRAGGRAYTVTDGTFPLDLGCGWLHSAQTPADPSLLRIIARAHHVQARMSLTPGSPPSSSMNSIPAFSEAAAI
jgi:monoamine oxidase